jgi:hypothetical protein
MKALAELLAEQACSLQEVPEVVRERCQDLLLDVASSRERGISLDE